MADCYSCGGSALALPNSLVTISPEAAPGNLEQSKVTQEKGSSCYCFYKTSLRNACAFPSGRRAKAEFAT